nr:MAG: hypothetical protein [Marnaviridae sp.]
MTNNTVDLAKLEIDCSLNGRRPPQHAISNHMSPSGSHSPTNSLLVNAGHMTFAMNQLPMSYVVLCEDVDRNIRAGVTAPLLGVCQSTVSISVTPTEWDNFPRYVLNTYYPLVAGKWINVLIDGEIVVSLFVKTMKHVFTFAKALCTVCDFPVCQCQCGSRSRPAEVVWNLLTESGQPIKQNNDFARRLGRGEINFHLVLEFVPLFFQETTDTQGVTRAVFQTGRVYESDYVENSRTLGSVLTDPEQHEPYLKLVEDLGCLWYQWRKSRTHFDAIIAVSACVRSVTGRSSSYLAKDLLVYIQENLKGFFITQSTSFSSTVLTVYEDYKSCKKSVLARKLHNVFTHVVARCLFDKLKVKYDFELVKQLEGPALDHISKRSLSSVSFMKKLEFCDAVVEMVAFLATQGYQAMKLGSIEPLLLSTSSIGVWHSEAKRLKCDYKHLANPKAAGIDLMSYLYRLDKCILEASTLAKYCENDTFEKKMIMATHLELISMQRDYLCLTAAQALRHQPFGVVLFGAPRVGKSSVLDAMCHAHSIRNKLDPAPGFRFQHNANEEYWTNFRTWQHTIVLDDVACHIPGKVQGVDPTIAELIKVVNNQPYCPAQAAIDDKGMTPVLSKLVVATTNKKDMNLNLYFTEPLAVMRRMNFHVTVIVKDEYRIPNTECIDTSKIPSEPYPDCWILEVVHPTKESLYDSEKIVFNHLRDFIDYFLEKSDEHHVGQEKFLRSGAQYYTSDSCGTCVKPMALCECLPEGELQTLRSGVFDSYDAPPSPLSASEVPFHEMTQDQLEDSVDRISSHVHPEIGEVDAPDLSAAHDYQGIYEDLFSSATGNTRPWRPVIEKLKKPRVFTERVAVDFLNSINLDQLHKHGMGFFVAQNYALGELPSLVAEYHWDDERIQEDFARYVVYLKEKGAIEDDVSLGLIMVDYMHNGRMVNHGSILDLLLRLLISLYFTWAWVRVATRYVSRFTIVRKIFLATFRDSLLRSEVQKHLVKSFGNHMEYRLQTVSPWAKVVVGSATALLGVATVLMLVSRCSEREPEDICCDEATIPSVVGENSTFVESASASSIHPSCSLQMVDELVAQEAVFETLREVGTLPKPKNESKLRNPWNFPERSLTTADFLDGRHTDLSSFDTMVASNMLFYKAYGEDEKGRFSNQGIWFSISNGVFVTNNHGIPEVDVIRVSVSFSGKKSNMASLNFVLKPSQLQRIPERDMVIIRTDAIKCRFKDLRKNFVRNSYDGVFMGTQYVFRDGCKVQKLEAWNVRPQMINASVGSGIFRYLGIVSKTSSETEQGDCGGPIVAHTGYGPVILGFHAMHFVDQGVNAAFRFSYEDYEMFASKVDVQSLMVYLDQPVVKDSRVSYIDFHKEPKILYHGEFPTRHRPKSRVADTSIASQLVGKVWDGNVISHGFSKPSMHPWKPQQRALKAFLEPVDNMDPDILQVCRDSFVKHILGNLPDGELDLLHEYPYFVALNGMPGVTYVDGIKFSTSMGFPYNTTKRKFLVDARCDKWPEGKDFAPEIVSAIERWYENYSKGFRNHPVFTANLKDEVVKQKKFDEDATRVFFTVPVEFLVCVRMAFMSFARIVQRNRDLFMCAIGTNSHSIEWHQLYCRLAEVGVDRCFAGDYRQFDSSFCIEMIKTIVNIAIDICVASGNFSEEAILRMKAIREDLASPTVDWFGMLVTLLGGEVSGHQLTAIFNSIGNIVYLLYVWVKLGKDPMDFFSETRVVVLGDDHVVTVSAEHTDYNHTSVTEQLAALGVGYTMADKTSESVPFINLNEATFLKRTFKFSQELGVYVGPLEPGSIHKSLLMQVASKNVSCEEQLAQALVSASMETFYHGKQAFVEFNAIIDSLILTPSLKQMVAEFPRFTYNQMVDRFWVSHPSTQARVASLGDLSLNQKPPLDSSYCTSKEVILQSLVRMDCPLFFARAFPKIRFYGSLLRANQGSRWNKFELAVPFEVKRLSKTNEETNGIQNSIPDTEGSRNETVQQTQFVNESAPEELRLGTTLDPTADSMIMRASLSNFLSRPARIFAYTWTENQTPGVKTAFSPWYEFFRLSPIKNKLANFGMIRCKLHVKFTINASQFYYGSLGAFYEPCTGFRRDTTGPNTIPEGRQILLSQQPHVWLDPQTISNAEMELPFLYPQNFLLTKDADIFTDMGLFNIVQFAALRSANGVTTTGVNIIAYAWATDVEVTGASSIAVMQSKKEYLHDGQISGPASTVAKVASRLKDIPVIGPFATGAEVISGAVANISSYFGYTNIPNVSDVQPVKQVSFHTLASAAISEPMNKLSLQPKQEISISNVHKGDPMADQLFISNFCARESFLGGTLWATGDAENKILFTVAVTPELYYKSTGTSRYTMFHTPMSYAAKMFQYWRGDLIFRFKIIRTQYHRGRLNLAWDVNKLGANSMPAVGDPTVQNIVIDLDESDTFEVRVPWMRPELFLTLADNGAVPGGPFWSNGPTPNFTTNCNGMLQLRVVNRLTAPEASSDVDVLVFVRAADNLEFAGPTDLPQTFTMATLQSKKEYTQLAMDTPSASDPRTYLEAFGERIVSFRELLHRQSRAVTQIAPKEGNWGGKHLIVNFPLTRLPRKYGYYSDGWDVALNTAQTPAPTGFNYVLNHPLNWIAYCFIGMSGSTNITANAVWYDGKASRAISSITISRQGDSTEPNMVPWVKPIPVTGSTSSVAREFNSGLIENPGAAGMALTNQFSQAALSANLPYYVPLKFIPLNVDYSPGVVTTQNGNYYDLWDLTLKRGVGTAGTSDLDIYIDLFYGSGPDFNLTFFINVPALYELSPPTAV